MTAGCVFVFNNMLSARALHASDNGHCKLLSFIYGELIHTEMHHNVPNKHVNHPA